MAQVWLTEHLDARLGNRDDEILLTNLSYGTRILAEPDSWDKLKAFQEPAELPDDDPWLERALKAHILVREGERDYPDSVLRLEHNLKRYLQRHEGKRPETPTTRDALLELLERSEKIFRENHMPKPYEGPATEVGPIMAEPGRLVDYSFDHIHVFLRDDIDGDRNGVDLEMVRQFSGRPALKLRYEQQFCTPRTTQLRAQRIKEAIKPGGRVLVLGDDDLVSLALVRLGGDFKVDVLELDADLVAFLKKEGGSELTVLEHNLRHGVPDSMRNAYDVVTTDPPYASDGMRFFLQCAVDSLTQEEDCRLFLSTYPGLLESPAKLWQALEDLHLKILDQKDHFSRYIYNNSYRVQHIAALRYLGSPLHPTTEILGFPYLYAHFFECAYTG